MAKLFINKDIAADADKLQYWLSGDDCVSFSDIQSFLDYSQDDPKIDIELHSCGGSCIEGYAIYDALRASGKEISATVVGTCASMATVILLAAPIERRSMYQNARLLIHNPHYPTMDGMGTIERLESALNGLKNEKERMLNVYVERTGRTREELEAQMATEEWFDGEKAIELGFVSYIVPPASANINHKRKEMKTEGKKPSVAEAFKMLGMALGIVKDGAEAKTITTSTGEKLDVERDEGEIQVGDKAQPDGNHVLEDGRTVVVVDGVITEIREASKEEEKESEEAKGEESTEEQAEGKESEGEGTAEVGAEAVEAVEKADAQEDTEKKALEDENNNLKAQVEALKGEIEQMKANAKSEKEARILAAVEKAGGEKWLTKAAASTYVPAGRSNEKPEGGEVKMSKVETLLAEARERNRKRYGKDKG